VALQLLDHSSLLTQQKLSKSKYVINNLVYYCTAFYQFKQHFIIDYKRVLLFISLKVSKSFAIGQR